MRSKLTKKGWDGSSRLKMGRHLPKSGCLRGRDESYLEGGGNEATQKRGGKGLCTLTREVMGLNT